MAFRVYFRSSIPVPSAASNYTSRADGVAASVKSVISANSHVYRDGRLQSADIVCMSVYIFKKCAPGVKCLYIPDEIN